MYISCILNSTAILYRLAKRPVLVLAIALLFAVPIIPLELWMIKTLVDQVQSWTVTDSIRPIIVTAAGFALLLGVNNIALGVPIPMAMTRLNEVSILEEQRLIIQKTSQLPLLFVESPKIKDLRERALRVSLFEIYNTNIHIVQTILQSAILIIVILAFGQWVPVAAVCLGVLFQSLISSKVAGNLERTSRQQTQAHRLLRYYARLMTKRDASKEIRLFDLGQLLSRRWSSLYEQQAQEIGKVTRTTQFLKMGPELLIALIGGLMIGLVVLLPGANELSAGDFTLLFIALTMLLSQLSGFVSQIESTRTNYLRWEDFRDYMELEDAPLQASDSAHEHDQHCPALLQVQNLSFRYPNSDCNALSDVTFIIPPGCRAALVGDNGSGKSTLIKLMTGMYLPDHGHIRWDNKDARTFAREGALSAVFQDFTRLYLTLRENVALGKLEALNEDTTLINVLQSAGSKLNVLETQLGAPFDGIEPSGGEWQKIATARGMLRHANFVFFDEPTAALDPHAEKAAFELFLRLTEERSALLVTHRLGAARLADKIFVLKEGKLVEEGTHDELMQIDGEYFKMFNLQAAWYV